MRTIRVSRSQLLRSGAAVVGSSVLLAACGQMAQPAAPGGAAPAAKEAPKAEAAPKAAQPAELVFMWPHYTDGKTRWLEWIVDTYNKKGTGVTIKRMDVAGSFGSSPNEKLQATVAGGNPPDVGWFGVGLHPFGGIVMDAKELLKTQRVDWGQFTKILIEGLSWQGKLLAAPIGINTTSIFYNKDLFDKAGVNYPKDDWTLEDLTQTAQKISQSLSKGDDKVWGFAGVHYVNHFMPLLYEPSLDAEGKKVTVNGPLGLGILKFWREHWAKLGIGPKPEDYKPQEDNQFYKAFENGKIAMIIYGTWGLEPMRRTKTNFDTVEPPTVVAEGKRGKGAFFGCEEIFTVASTKKVDAAAQFVAWLVGPEHLEWTGAQGNIIPAIPAIANKVFLPPQADGRPKNQLSFARAADYAKPWFPHPAYGQLSTAYGNAVLPYWQKEELTAEQALAKAQQDTQKIVDDWNKANL